MGRVIAAGQLARARECQRSRRTSRAWDLRIDPPAGNDGGRGGGRRGEGGGGEGGGGRGGAPRGAQVLPGTCAVKMIAGPAAIERKVTVEIDPELKSSVADLESQWRTLEKISTMIRTTRDMSRQSDHGANAPAWEKFQASLAGSRLAEKLQSLFTLVDASNDPPTEAMRKLLDELESDYDRFAERFER